MRRLLSFLLFLLLPPSHLLAAELWLREALVKEHTKDILVTIQAVPDQIGTTAHPLKEDCDLHVPLRSEDIRVPLLGEIKNACSYPEGKVTPTYWPKRLRPLEGKTIEAEGVLRVWLEHPPKGDEKQCECYVLPYYFNSNPDHMVELHPLTRLGDISFLDQTWKVRQGDKPYLGYRVDRLQTLEKKRIRIRRAKEDGETYIAIRGPKTGFNHWTVWARVKSVPENRKDGKAFEVAILDGNKVVKPRLRALTIKGTAADMEAETLQPDERVWLFGIVRMDLEVIEREAGPKWKTIPMPYELIVLDILR